jgi:hypothetical protein
MTKVKGPHFRGHFVDKLSVSDKLRYAKSLKGKCLTIQSPLMNKGVPTLFVYLLQIDVLVGP